MRNAFDRPIYHCDPTKNTNCPKTHCYLGGGECQMTTEKQYSKEDNNMATQPGHESLEVMLNMQTAFQRRVDPRFESADLKERAAFIRDHFVYLDQELQEALYEVPYFKHWKDYSKMTDEEIAEAYTKYKEEMVDAWHFFMNMLIAAGMTAEELFFMYMEKNKENIRRQDEGYDHTMKHIGITSQEEN